MEIRQGDIFWIDLGEPEGSEPGYRRPYVVVQNNLFNNSQINTIIVCAVTSNAKMARFPGNIILDSGEGGLSKTSVVNVSQLYTVGKRDLAEFSGRLSPQKVRQIIYGINLLIQPADIE